jgi:hypothetical protein
MKIILFLFVFLLFPISDSFGVNQTELGDNVFIFVQSTIRNSDGVLVAYLESTKFTNLNLSGLKSFLDIEVSRGIGPVITIDGQNFQVIRRVQSQSFDSERLVASTVLYDKIDDNPTILARFAHDGYYVESGDTLESMWTFIRPVS